MIEYRVVWCQCPTSQHSTRVLFVEANNKEDARKLARSYIERKFGVEWFVIGSTAGDQNGITEVERMPPGHVKEMDGEEVAREAT